VHLKQQKTNTQKLTKQYKHRTTKPWYSCLLWLLARKQTGSILTTTESGMGHCKSRWALWFVREILGLKPDGLVNITGREHKLYPHSRRHTGQ